LVNCLERGANDDAYGPSDASATLLLFASLKSRIHDFIFLVLAHSGCHGEEAIKSVLL